MDLKPIIVIALVAGCLGKTWAYPSDHTIKQNFQITETQSLGKLLASNQSYKERLRDLLTVKYNDHFQIRLDKIKMGAVDSYQLDRLSFEPALHARKTGTSSAQGYGLKVKFTLD